jgi:anti-anti-sigma regulatory factor
MASTPGQTTVVVEGDTAYVAVTGRACAEGARDFKRFVEGRRAEGIGRVVLDLSRCILMDSTFSGVLAGLVTGDGTPRLRFVLVSPNDRVTDLLDNLGVLPLMGVVALSEGRGPSGAPEVLPASAPDRQGDAECCLDAHRLLMTLRPENVVRFATLEKYLAAQVDEAVSGGGG